uniref:Chloride channel protein n=1 Tax=Rhodosorus marinus TaxID=101924 RepID=A0A7S2ZDH2_9RHOD|mmetsp:Transcript_15596/g.63643  ORF Transcript_15596/g.63643 Transcript_15596/m.63643 type:complete len:499 (+) Transcript_15596:119-1615(+)
MWSWIRSPLKGKGLPGLDGIRKRKWSDLFGDNDDSEGKGHQTKVQMTCGVHGTTADLSRLVPYMTLLGIVAASFISIVDIFTHVIFEARKRVSVDITHGAVGYVIYVSSGVLLCLLSTLVCQQWSKEAEGSGLPQMKSIMSGFHDKLRNSLAVEALAAKAVGLICAIGGGLPVGWEGPNVHMSCIIAEYLSRIPYFHSLRQDKALRLQMMACACTVGLASSFGTPIGAVLYALESTSSFYLVPTFWKSILATISGAMVFDIWYKTPVAEAFENTTFGPDDYRRSQLILFCLLGTFMGIVGAFFVKCTHEVYQFRKRRLTYLSNRFVLVGVVALVSGLAQYNNELLRIDPRKAINELFSSNAMQLMTYSDVMFLLLIKFPLIAVCVGLPIPGGVFISSFLMGAGCGRLYGEFLRTVFGPSIVPGLYAVVGAASLAGGVTRALSCSVLIFEVTGQISHMMPILVAVLLSVTVANSFNQSLYDTLIVMKVRKQDNKRFPEP